MLMVVFPKLKKVVVKAGQRQTCASARDLHEASFHVNRVAEATALLGARVLAFGAGGRSAVTEDRQAWDTGDPHLDVEHRPRSGAWRKWR